MFKRLLETFQKLLGSEILSQSDNEYNNYLSFIK